MKANRLTPTQVVDDALLTVFYRAEDRRAAAECAVASLRDAGLLAEGEVVGYAVVGRNEAKNGHWTFVEGRYDSRDDAQADAQTFAAGDPSMTFRVAALHLLPEEPSDG